MNGDVAVENNVKSMVLGATVRPRHKDHVKPQSPQPQNPPSENATPSENPYDSCETCQTLLEKGSPLVSYANVSNSDVLYDRTLLVYKMTGKPEPENNEPPKVLRQLDRFEEAKFWDLIGLTPKMYARLTAQLRKVNSKRLVFKKCPYRLHNTRHFAVPLEKKAGRKEDIYKATYEDDRKLMKRNQAYECHWDDCMHSFRDPQDMRIHYMFDHESVKIFCCGKRYENYDSFLEHYVTSPENKKHAWWTARECWGCQKRFIDASEFTDHTDVCEFQMSPFPCPDPLCPMKYESCVESIDHFYLWHDPAGSIVFNDVEYGSRDEIQLDLPLIDDGQLVLLYPLKAVYRCLLCHVQFAAESYFTEHMKVHIEQPQIWLGPTIMYCMSCKVKHCYYQLEQLIEIIPKLMKLSETMEPANCRINPLVLIWRIFLTDEFSEIFQRIYARLLAERERLSEKPRVGCAENHKELDVKRIAYILDSLFYLYTQKYEKGQPRQIRF